MTAQAYLEQLINIDRRIKDKLRESAEWRSIAMSKSSNIDEVKVQSSHNKAPMEDAVCKAVQYEKEAAELAEKLSDLKHTIVGQIDTMDGEEYLYLKDYYVYGVRAGTMADKYNYTYQGMKKKLRIAVAAFAKKYGNKY